MRLLLRFAHLLCAFLVLLVWLILWQSTGRTKTRDDAQTDEIIRLLQSADDNNANIVERSEINQLSFSIVIILVVSLLSIAILIIGILIVAVTLSPSNDDDTSDDDFEEYISKYELLKHWGNNGALHILSHYNKNDQLQNSEVLLNDKPDSSEYCNPASAAILHCV